MDDERERTSEDDVVEEFFRVLEARGVPQGTWLVEIEQVRESLQAADSLLRRLAEAVIRAASESLP